MNNILTLCRVFLKTGSDSGNKKKKGANLSPIFMAIFLVVVLGLSLGFPLVMLLDSLYDGLAPLGQQGVLVGLVITMNLTILFIFGIIYTLSTFYFSKDVEYLLPLPLKPYEITMGKFITVLVYEYLTEIVVLAIPLIFFGIKDGSGPMYWII